MIKSRFISGRSLILLLIVLHLPGAWAQAPSAGEPNTTDADTAGRHYPNRILWGDTHLHTALALDAGLMGVRPGLEEAYRFAGGQ